MSDAVAVAELGLRSVAGTREIILPPRQARLPVGAPDRRAPIVDAAHVDAFVRLARAIAGRDATSPFSLEDVYTVASKLGLCGVLFLEKSDETRHVNVVLGLDDRQVVLYDPRTGVKVKDGDETLLGMYCRPVGSFRDELEELERRGARERSDVWARYARRGRLLKQLLGHGRFQRLFSAGARSFELPALQCELRPSDCAPISLFVISLVSATERGAKATPGAAGAADQRNRHRERHNMVIQIFVTGGTFDKEYDELGGTLVFKDTHIQELLRLGRCKQAVDIRTLMMIDSLEMSEMDRQLIVESCRKCKRERIVITHGTDSMEVTARALGPAIKDKTVVLTGAMVPYKLGSSDGLFNLGSALAFVQSLPHGVYVAMNGRCFSWDKVQKNRATGEFEEIASAS